MKKLKQQIPLLKNDRVSKSWNKSNAFCTLQNLNELNQNMRQKGI